MSTAAKMKGILGVVIDGACRDLAEHHALDFPVSPSVNHGSIVLHSPRCQEPARIYD